MDVGALGIRIRNRREIRGLRQADLATALRVSPQAVSKWERGENAPDISILVALARMLDVSVEWLLTGASERETFEGVVFVTRIEGFLERSPHESPRALAAWINGIHATTTETVRQHDGVPVKYVGDGFLAFLTGAHACDRAIRAALQCRRIIAETGLVISLHMGDIYLGLIGHPDYAVLDILGSTVNTAFAILSRTAERCPEQIAVTRAVRDGSTDLSDRFRHRGELMTGHYRY